MKRTNSKISIIIPVLNEAETISTAIAYLQNNSCSKNIKEIIIIDGGSDDNTAAIAKNAGATVLQSPKGRAKQMNCGAKHATAELLYFLHADTLPPKDFDTHILDAYQNGDQAGCFQMKFDSQSRFLDFFAWFTRFNYKLCRGGDQSLFITKKLFQSLKGFNEDYMVFEDNEFIGRIYNVVAFKILDKHVKTSARRYDEKGTITLQYHFGVIHLKNYLGAGPEQLYEYYRRKISV